MEKKIDIKGLALANGHTLKSLGEYLFPGNKYPYMALKRVIDGESELTESQIKLLSALTGETVEDLFTIKSWKAKAENEIMVFTKGNIRCLLNLNTGETKIFKDETLSFETIILTKGMTLGDFIDRIDGIVNQNQKHK